uniref:Protein grainyhead n=1 Tax=Aceria tosichella TaxID=561515 RepID=A0A6G1SIU1_9ACAR
MSHVSGDHQHQQHLLGAYSSDSQSPFLVASQPQQHLTTLGSSGSTSGSSSGAIGSANNNNNGNNNNNNLPSSSDHHLNSSSSNQETVQPSLQRFSQATGPPSVSSVATEASGSVGVGGGGSGSGTGGADGGTGAGKGAGGGKRRAWSQANRQANKTEIAKVYSPHGFRCYLEAPISTCRRREEDRITYINKGEFYGLTLDYIPDPQKPLRSAIVKAVIMLVFREDKSPEDDMKSWQFWHSRQHSAKQRILDVDNKNHINVINQIEEVSLNAIAFYWNPIETRQAKLNIAIQCLSTDFSNQKGVKGLPLNLQVDIYDLFTETSTPVYRAYATLLSYCDKGAQRRSRDEERRALKRKLTDQSVAAGGGAQGALANSKKFDDLYHKPCDRTEFYSMADLIKSPTLYSPTEQEALGLAASDSSSTATNKQPMSQASGVSVTPISATTPIPAGIAGAGVTTGAPGAGITGPAQQIVGSTVVSVDPASATTGGPTAGGIAITGSTGVGATTLAPIPPGQSGYVTAAAGQQQATVLGAPAQTRTGAGAASAGAFSLAQPTVIGHAPGPYGTAIITTDYMSPHHVVATVGTAMLPAGQPVITSSTSGMVSMASMQQQQPQQSHLAHTVVSAGPAAAAAAGQQQQQQMGHSQMLGQPPIQQQHLHHQHHHHHQQQQQVIHRQNSLLTQAYRPSAQNMGANTTNNRQQRQVPAPIQRSVSNLNPPMMGAAGQPNRLEQEASQDKGSYHRRQMDMPPYDRRAAIRSYLMKGSGTGGSSNQHNMNWGHQQQQQQHQQQHAFRGNAPPPPSAHPNATGKSQDLPRQRVVAQQQWTSPAPSSIERNNTAQAAAGQTPATAASQEDLRARTVDIVREASNIIAKIMSTTDAVAFDCKGYNLGFDGKITLIQFGFLPTKQVDPMQLANSMNKRFALSAPTSASPAHHHHHQSSSDQQTNNQDNGGDNENGDQQANKENNDSSTTKKHLKPEVCVFDLITNPELAYCLKPLLESDKIVKIVHDVRNKSNALHVQFNIILNNVFDTQVANLVIQQQVTGKPAYKSRYISMGKLCEIYGSDDLVRYRDMIKFKTSGRGGGSGNSSNKDVNYWRSRPLTRSMILEATMDVYCLVGGIYQNLKESIKPEYKPLFDLLNLEGVLARIKPEEIRSAKKERKIDMEVIDLKRKLYSDTTGPVVLSNREIRLLRHIDLTEGVRQKIQQCKKVAKKLERLDMKAALLRQQQLEQSDGTAAEGGEDGRQQQLTSLNSQLSSLNSHSNNSSLGAVGGANGSGLSKEEEQRQEQLRARLEEFNAAVAMMDDNSMFDELKDRLNESTSLLESLENDDDDDEERDEEAQLSSGHHSHNGSSINDCCRCQCHSHSHSNSNSLSNSHSQQQSSLESGAGAARSQGGGQPGEVVKPPELIGATVQTDETTEAKKGEPVNSNNSECRPQTKLTHHDVQDETSAKEESQAQKKEEAEAHKEDSSKPSDLNSSDNNTLPQGQAKGTQGEQESSGKEEPCGDDESDDSKSSACDMAVQCDLLS